MNAKTTKTAKTNKAVSTTKAAKAPAKKATVKTAPKTVVTPSVLTEKEKNSRNRVKAQNAFKAAVDNYRANFTAMNAAQQSEALDNLRKLKEETFDALIDADMAVFDVQLFVEQTLGSVVLTKAVGNVAANKHTKPAKPAALATPAVPATTAPAEAKEKPVKPTKKEEVIVHKSSVESPVAFVWRLAREMKGARRKDVVAAAIAQGIATHTARTQYQAWFQANKAGSVRPEEKKDAAK